MVPIDPRFFVDPTPPIGARLGQILGRGASAYTKNALERRAYRALGLPEEAANLSPQVQSAYIKQSQKNKVAPYIADLLNNRQNEQTDGNYLLPAGQTQPPTAPTVSPLPGVPTIPTTATTSPSPILPGVPTASDVTIPQTNDSITTEQPIETVETTIPQPVSPPQGIRLPSYIQRPVFNQQDVNALAVLDPKAAKIYQEQINKYNADLKDFGEKQEKQAQPTIDRANTLSTGLARQQYGIDSMRDAIRRGGRFGLDYIAQRFGLPFLATPEGSQLNTVKKQFLITDIEGLPRPNLFIDKKVDEAYPQLGKSEAANNTTLEVLQAKHDIESKYVELSNQFAAEDRQNYGFVQANLQKRVTENLNEYAQDRYKLTERRLIDINYPDKVPFKLMNPDTKKYDYFVVPHEQVDYMLNNGAEVDYEF